MANVFSGDPEKMWQAAVMIDDEGQLLHGMKQRAWNIGLELASIHKGESACVHQTKWEGTLSQFAVVHQRFVALGEALNGAGTTTRAMEEDLTGLANQIPGGNYGTNGVSSQINYR